MGPGSDAALLERDDERRALDWAVNHARHGDGEVVVIEGVAGVGKTSLLDLADALSAAAGMRVLRARGSELDRAFGFGLVRGLLERTVAEMPDLLAGMPERVAAIFGAGTADAHAEPDLFGRLHGLYWLVAELAADQPVALIADDLHWADTASLRWLVFMAERIAEIPAVMVCATRPEEPGADQELLDALAATARPLIRPAPLSPAAAGTLIRARIPDAVAEFATACHTATGGNPFLLGELVSEAAAEQIGGSAADAGRILEFGSERVGRAIRRRLRALDEDATDVGRAVAVLGPPVSLDDVLGLTGLSRAPATAAVEALIAINILAADRELDFVHPVVRSAVYAQIPSLRRQELHERAAALVSERGAEHERVARHLLALPGAGDPARLATLRAAARDADARGAADAAIAYLRRAVDEPPPPDELAGVLHELGLEEAADRRRDDFDAHLRQALSHARDPEHRTRIALDLGRALASCGEFRLSVERFHETLTAGVAIDDTAAVALEAEMLAMAFHEFTCAPLAAPFWERRFAELDRGDPVAPEILAPLTVAIAASRGPAGDAIALAERVLASGELGAPNSVLVGAIGNGLIYAGALSRASQVYSESIAAATRRGNRLAAAWQSTMASKARLRLGDIRGAEADARLALEVFQVGSGEPGIAWCVAHLLDALVARGALDEGEELVGRFGPPSGADPTLPLALLRTSLAHFHLARGIPTAALREATAAGQLISGAIANPYCCDWRSTRALALAGLDRGDEAVATAEAELADARAFGVPAAVGASLRTLGLVTGGAEGVAMLRAAVATLEGTDGRLEHARALLDLGVAVRHRGARTEARDRLRVALDETARIGASGLADRAHEELIAAGARPRRDRRLLSGRESLTAGEDRVALLAAQGLTNREIAQRQFVTVKAVQWHLRNIYRKLDVTSREDLPSALHLGS
ncbi:MAG TPA: AAA family ATPase [Solirubrobacteraceae bacterium]